jgi:hypothetical protein
MPIRADSCHDNTADTLQLKYGNTHNDPNLTVDTATSIDCSSFIPSAQERDSIIVVFTYGMSKLQSIVHGDASPLS